MVFGWFKRNRSAGGRGNGSEGIESPTAVAEVTPVVADRSDVAPSPVPVLSTEPLTPPASAHIPDDKIAARAYEIWVRKGRPDGADLVNWQEAEAELRAEFASAQPPGPALRKPR